MDTVSPEISSRRLSFNPRLGTHILDALKTALSRSRVVVLAGPHQSGKTTLARELLAEDSTKLKST